MRAITSLANPTVKILRGLASRQGRKKNGGLFLAEGARIIMDALEAGWQPRHLAFLAGREDDENLRMVIKMAQQGGAELLAVSEMVLGKISRKDNPQMVLASFEENWQAAAADAKTTGCRIGLDRVRDPGNLGTILRSADAVGAGGIILIGECCDAFSPEAVRASMGAVFTIPMTRMDEKAFIDYAKGSGCHVIGTALPAATDYRDANWQSGMILLMGNEQGGLSDNLKAACDELVQLPMQGRADSLNLGVATGICLYEYVRRSSADANARK